MNLPVVIVMVMVIVMVELRDKLGELGCRLEASPGHYSFPLQLPWPALTVA